MNETADHVPSGTPVYSSENQLPPVEPPAGSFLVQLFVTPLLIVSIIVAVWLMFSWLARTGTDPQELVRDIERLNHASWQKALTLAQQLRDPRNSELRQDQQLASHLSDLLRRQIDEANDDEERRKLRIFLCRALGEFDVDTGYPALAVAATRENDVADSEVRRAALQAIGILSARLDPHVVDSHEDVLKAVLMGTDEFAETGDEKLRRDLLRSTATYVLGLIPGIKATQRLGEMLDDPNLDVTYNAAIGLARHGDSRAIPVLEEMLDPPAEALDYPDPHLTEKQRSGQSDWKRSQIVVNALRSVAKMCVDYPALDMGSLQTRVEELAADKSQPGPLRFQAQEVSRVFDRVGGQPEHSTP